MQQMDSRNANSRGNAKAKYKESRSGHQKIAHDRIANLLLQAQQQFPQDKGLSKRYVILARKLSTRYKARLTAEQKKMFCKKCNALLKTGVNSRIRLEHGKIALTCLECNAVKRMDYRKEKRIKMNKI